MRVHYLQHAAFEGLGSIGPWLDSCSATVTKTELFRSADLPSPDDFDWLIVMGGPMSVNEEDRYPWLAEEKRLIAEAVRRRRTVLGICLGAQLIAASQEARVYPNREKEIGWFAVRPAPALHNSPFSSIFRSPMDVFHWHGETFDLPAEAVHLVQSEACKNQAFAIGGHVVGLQFHPEMTAAGAEKLIAHCGDELVPAPWIQDEAEMLRDPERFRRGNRIIKAILEVLWSGSD